MAEPLGPSFIPKQSPARVARRVATRQVYVFTIASYVVLFATLIAVAALYIYGRLTASTLAKAVQEYDTEIASFEVDKMHEVIELHERLSHTRDLLDANISMRAALAVLEAETIDTVQFSNLTFTRGEGNQVQLDAVVQTDTFDSVLFQREIYEEADKLIGVSVDNVVINFVRADSEGDASGETTVGFSAVFDVSPSALAYQPAVVASSSEAETTSSGPTTPTSTPPEVTSVTP